MSRKSILRKLNEQGIIVPCLALADFDTEDLEYISENSERLIPELKDGMNVKIFGIDYEDDCVFRIPC